MTEFGVVIVTWHPTAGNIAHAAALAAYCGHVCVVDNSPRPQPWYTELSAAGIQVLHNGNAGGLGGAFNRGIDWLVARGIEVFFTFDQDSELGPEYFDEMLATPPPSGRPYIAGPVIHELNTGCFMLGSEFITEAAELARRTEPPTLATDFLVSSGTMITAAAWHAFGRFDERYVIDYLDWDFCHRMARSEVDIVVNTAVTLRHRIGNFRVRTWRGKPAVVIDYAPTRRYYQTRNCLYFTTRNARDRRELLAMNVYILRNLRSIILFERHRASKLLALAAGVVDGILGRLGPFTDTQARIAALVSR